MVPFEVGDVCGCFGEDGGLGKSSVALRKRWRKKSVSVEDREDEDE
jgi:hypothetical protein